MDLCTDSQSMNLAQVRKATVFAYPPNWTNSFADNDGSYWNNVNGGASDNHPADTFYMAACCPQWTPTISGEQTIGGVRVFKINNTQNATWSQATAACRALGADLCDKGQYYVLRANGAISNATWASDHSDNDGSVANEAIGSMPDNPNPSVTTDLWAYACCGTKRKDSACPSGTTDTVQGVCVAKVNNGSASFASAATDCANQGARICSIAQSAILRAANKITASANWVGSYGDNDGSNASVGVGPSYGDNQSGGSLGYACCY